MAKSYNWQNIGNLLTEAFTDEELRRFLFESPKFRPVYEQLSQQTGKASIIDLLLDYADRKNLVDPLLLWTREQNPAYYEQCKPYYKHIPYWRALIERLRRQVQRGLNRPATTSNTLLILSPLFILILLSALLIYHYFYQRPSDWLSSIWPAPPIPDTGFNIAVAQFTPLGETGSLDLTEGSQKLSDWLYKGISDQTEQNPDLNANVWGPADVGIINGGDADARAENAKLFTTQYNVHLLIYGVVTERSANYEFQPEFYVSWQGFEYGSEVTGPNRLGHSVPFTLPLEAPSSLQRLNNTIKNRREVLQYLVAGLNDFYVGDYDKASDKFGWALDAESSQGQDVIYLLSGAAKLLTADSLKAKPAERSQLLNEAAIAFTQAISWNTSYARGYLGLGAVALQQATNYSTDGMDIVKVDPTRLIEARDWYSNSLRAGDQSPSAYVPIKVNHGLGQIYFVGYRFGFDWSKDEARRFLNRVIEDYKTLEEPSELTWFAGDVHGILCRLNGFDNRWADMAAECRQANDLLDSLPRTSSRIPIAIAHNWVWLACAEKKLGNFDEARQAYRQAVKNGQGYIPPEKLVSWQEASEHVEEGDSCGGT
jgi:tetratricopeptide (TPR) repeat protein